jgi:hypothetical protein
MSARTHELCEQGLDSSHANGIAWLEERIRRWPSGWGNDLHILIYGDFKAPDAILSFPSLGITINPGKQSNTIVTGARTVLQASVKIDEKSVTALIDAARRINLLLGAYTLTEWAHA